MSNDFKERFGVILTNNPSIKEKDFVTLYLDGLLQQDKTIIEKWYQIAGNPFHSVNVVDNSNKDKILFIVPPLQRKDQISMGNLHINDVLTIIDLKRKRHAPSAELASKQLFGNAILDEVVDKDDIIAWRNIIRHYKKEHLLPALNAINNNIDDGCEWE